MGQIDFYKLAVKAADIADSKKAEDIIILDIQKLTAMANFFVIATATSTPQINAICAEIEKTFKEEGVMPVRREGIASTTWRVIDYGGLVVHMMTPDVRDTYNLERLWQQAENINFSKPMLKIKAAAQAVLKEKDIVEKAVKKTVKTAKKKMKKAEKKAVKLSKKADKKIAKVKKAVKKDISKAGKKIATVKKKVKAVKEGVKAFKKAMKKK